MKQLVLYLSLLILSLGKLICQNADCINSILLCSNPSFTFNVAQGNGNVNDVPASGSVSNPDVNPASSNQGCLQSGELHPQWLLISIGNSGMLEFVFGAGNSPNPQAGFYDWAMWPYSPNACADIMNNLLPPIRCNWNAFNSGGTGIASASNIPPGGNQGNFEPPLPVNPCDQFIICISNYSNISTLVSFLSLGTASLSCNPSCASFEICAGNNVTITPINVANLTGTTYSLNPGGLINTTGTFVVSPLTSQTYSSYITGVNSTNAIITTSAIISIIVHPQPMVIPSYTLSTCTSTVSAFDMNLTFNPPSPGPSYTVSWGAVPNNVTTNQQTSATDVMAGTYPVTVTAQGGCKAITNINISPQPAQATFTFIPFGTNSYTLTCAQPVMDISTTNALLNYTWTNTNTGVVNGTATSVGTSNLGTWTVSAAHPASGCTSTHSFVVGQDFALPVISSISPALQNITCANPSIQTVTATATSPTINIVHQFVSQAGGTVAITSNPAIFQPGPTNYTYTLLNAENGCSVSQTFSVLAAPGFPTFAISSTPTLAGQGNYTIGCNNHSLTVINILSPNTTPNPGGGLDFGFIAPGQGTNYIPTSLQTTVVSIPGTWTLIALSTNNNCETRIPVTIIQNTVAPNLSAYVPTQILSCATPSTILSAQSSNENATPNWLIPGLGSFPSPTVAVNSTTNTSSTSAGNYTLVILDQNNGCTSNSVIPMQQNMFAPKANISVTSNTITCFTPTLQLTNASTTGIPPGVGFPTTGIVQAFVWEGPAPQPTLGLQSSYIAATPGTYTLTVKDLNNGCMSYTTLVLQDGRIYPVVTPQASPYLFDCGAASATIMAVMSNTQSMSYQWTGPSTATFVAGTATAQIAEVKTVGLYNVIITNVTNGCSGKASVSLANGALSGGFTPNNTSGFAPLTVNFTNNSKSSSPATGTQSITSLWNFGNGTTTTYTVANSNASNGQAIYTQPGTYKVVLYTSKGSCTDIDTVFIQVDIPSSLEVPNVFTPNGDGVNDLFFLKVANLTEIKITIYDRWGHITYELSSETGNIAWDGKNLYGKEAAEGIYFYNISAKGKDGQEYAKKGNLTLMR